MTLVPPVLVIVSDNGLLPPTVMLPKARLLGLAVRVPAETPVPERGIVSVGLEPLEVIVTLPLTLPTVEGAKVTVKDALLPEARVTGVVIPLRVNPAPLTPTCEIVTLDPPLFVIVSDRG